jgi:DNA-binding NarL/FixJ family response regulator
VVAELRSFLGDEEFDAAWEEGGALPLHLTIELVNPKHAAAGADTVDTVEELTPREAEVLALVARGLTDAEVAERLVVSLRTVHAHLRSTYRKLDVHSRSAATRYALEHGLAT